MPFYEGTLDEPKLMCANCGVLPAVCIGLYEGAICEHEEELHPDCDSILESCSDRVDQPSCGKCCDHLFKTAHCHPIVPSDDELLKETR